MKISARKGPRAKQKQKWSEQDFRDFVVYVLVGECGLWTTPLAPWQRKFLADLQAEPFDPALRKLWDNIDAFMWLSENNAFYDSFPVPLATAEAYCCDMDKFAEGSVELFRLYLQADLAVGWSQKHNIAPVPPDILEELKEEAAALHRELTGLGQDMGAPAAERARQRWGT